MDKALYARIRAEARKKIAAKKAANEPKPVSEMIIVESPEALLEMILGDE